MSKLAVRIENLGKKFVIGHRKDGDLRETFGNAIKGFFRRGVTGQEEFWALRNLDLEIKAGDVVGIIGRNGAGKSTLLKILSRITLPTTGRFEIDGRVSSLLEVGTGFHPELTGRENIFLNGTILGMRRDEIKGKFDEIVAFSGVENFIDTPVKHYSSGMKVRLAFSVAAHLEPEILIIDEVLAVGDAEFQAKCLGKMDEVSKEKGRTILFVSHNLAAVEHLCSTAILLDKGNALEQGNVSDVLGKYTRTQVVRMPGQNGATLTKDVILKDFHFLQSNVGPFDDLEYEITIESKGPNRFTDLAMLVYNHLNERVGIVDFRHQDLLQRSAHSSVLTVRGRINGISLMDGTYHCGLFVSSMCCQGDFLNLASFEIKREDSEFVPYAAKHRGYLEFNNSFTIA